MIGKIVYLFLRLLGFGAGTWPGEIALRVNPHIFSSFASQFRKGIILVAGTNGKTTTALMIKTILEARGLRVVHNASGANLLNGIVSACIQDSSWTGKLHADYGVFEVDENSLPIVIKSIKSVKSKVVIVLLNLFRDQLDRYGEVDVIAGKWESALQGSNAMIIANSDDPLVAHLGLHAKTTFFGINDKTKFLPKMEHATDSIFCLNCGSRLKYEGIYFSHLGIWSCTKCGEKRPEPDIKRAKSPLPGLYNRYNTLAAMSVAKALGVTMDLAGFHPAFGRQEEIGDIKIFLSKNPAGFNESLRTVIELNAKSILLALNDRIPDGRDVSWIWDVDFEMLPKNITIFVTGDRVLDMAVRLKYAEFSAKIVSEIPKVPNLFILATYSAMLEIRKRLLGRKIL